jgi:hypothetical protein
MIEPRSLDEPYLEVSGNSVQMGSTVKAMTPN